MSPSPRCRDEQDVAWHFITPEYPPQRGGVGDVARAMARQIVAAGREAHVWTSHDASVQAGEETTKVGIHVHRLVGNFSPRGLRRMSRELATRAPAKGNQFFLHWVPHGYGLKAINVFLPLWLLARVWKNKDRLDIYIHEPCVAWAGGVRQRIAGAFQRFMLMLLFLAADNIWLSTLAWESGVRYWLSWLGRSKAARTPVRWLPLRIDLPILDYSDAKVAAFRATLCPAGAPLVGHFGTYGELITQLLCPALEQILSSRGDAHILLLGRGSRNFREEFLQRHPAWNKRFHFLDGADGAELSLALTACDLLLQPFPDGITTRRTSVLAGLAHCRAVVSNTGHLTETALWQEAGAVNLQAAAASKNSVAQVLAEASCELLADDERRTCLALRGKDFYERHFATDNDEIWFRKSPGA